jgi:filamentous hemagglutinin family protein
MTLLRTGTGFLLTLGFVLMSARAAEPVPDQGQGTTATESANGTPMVQIENPNDQGLSHNLYEHFDVGEDGLILNNSRKVTQTEQAGHIAANPNLENGPADIILNEVVEANPSSLRGYMEVGGPAADVVVANPWGISCDGCGFINTNRATLTTGKPEIHNGMLDGFAVDRGRVSFEGEGLNADNVASFDVIARSVELNAELHGQDIRMITGAQDVDYEDLSISEVRSDGDKPSFAISSSAFGGIYGDRIEMIANEDGVGVNLDGPVAAQTGNLKLSADGKLAYDRLSAKDNVALDAGSVTARGDTTAGNRFDVEADAVTLAEGSHSAQRIRVTTDQLKLHSEVGVAAGDELDLDLTALNNDGILSSGGRLRLDLDKFTPEGRVQGKEAVAVNAGHSIRIPEDYTWKLNGDLELSAEEGVVNQGRVSSSGETDITAGEFTNDGDLAGLKGLEIRADVIDNKGQSLLLSGNTMNLGVKRLRNRGDIYSVEHLFITGRDGRANRVANTSGLIGTGQGNISIESEQVVNEREGQPRAEIAEGDRNHYYRDKNGKSAAEHRTCFKRSMADECQGFTAFRYTITPEHAEVVDKSRAGRIYSGKNMEIAGSTIRNVFSKIASAGDMTLDVQSVYNMSFSKEVTDDLRIDTSWHDEEEHEFHSPTDLTITTVSPKQNSHFCHAHDATGCHYISYYPLNIDYLDGIDKSQYPQEKPDSRYRKHSVTGLWLATLERCKYKGYGEPTCTQEYEIREDRPTLLPETERSRTTRKSGAVTTRLVDTTAVHRLTWKDGGDLLVRRYREGLKPNWVTQKRMEHLIPGLVEAGGTLDIRGEEINNGNSATRGNADVSFTNTLEELTGQATGDDGERYRKAPFVGNDFRLPGEHGLFVLNQDPEHRYLIETNPLFTKREEFLGSAWMLDKLDWNPDGATRLLGDGFYELQRLRENLQGTSRSLAGMAWEEKQEEYRDLMNNGLYASEDMELSPGVEVTAEQINALEKDMVWPEKTKVAGETVMVPVVYFAGGSEVEQKKSSIVAENVQMKGEEVANTGRIEGEKNVEIESTKDDLVNKGVIEGSKSVKMDSANDIRNSSGSVQGGDIRMEAEGDIVNERITEQHQGQKGSFTAVGEAGRIEGDGKVVLDAGEDIRFSGSSLSGKSVGLAADGDTNIGTARLESEYKSEQAGHSLQSSATHHLGSAITSTLDLVVEAEKNISVLGSAMGAGENMKVGAGGDLRVAAARERQRSNASTDLGDGSRSREYSSVRHQASNLAAGGDLSMGSGGDMTMIASNASAGENLGLKAEGEMELLSGKNSTFERSVTQDGGLLETETHISESYNEDVVSTSLNAGDDLLINAESGAEGISTWDQAEGDVTLEGVQASAGNRVFGYAGGDMNVLPAQSRSYEHNETRTSLSRVAGGLAAAAQLSLEATLPGASSAIDTELASSESRGSGSTRLTGTSISSGSGTTLLAGGDANIVAGDVGAGQNGRMKADNLGLGNLSVEAGMNKESEGKVRIMGGREQEYSYARESSTQLGTEFSGGKVSFARKNSSSRRTEKAEWVGSRMASSGDISMTSSGNMQIVGSQLNSQGDLNLDSGGDMHVLTGSDMKRTSRSTSASEFKVEGTAGGSSAELFAGYEKDRHVTTEEKRTSVASRLTGKNVSLDSERDINVVGSDLAATGEMTEESLNGGNLELDAGRDLNTSEGVSEQTQTVIDENFRTGISITARENVSSASRAVRNVGDASNNVNRASSALRAVDSVSAARSGGVTSSAGVVAEWSRSETSSTSQQARVSALSAANNMTLKSGEDQNHSGTRAFAGNNLEVDSGGKVNLNSAQNRRSMTTTRENASVNIGLSEQGPSVTTAGGQAERSVDSVQHISATFTAGNTASVESEGDTTLAGGVVQGKNIETDIAGDLTIKSRQDTRSVDAESVQGSLTVGPAGPSSASLSVSETEGDKAWVDQQSGLFAADRADVRVEEHTQLTGGAIYSKTGNMTLNTGSFDYSNIRGHDEKTTTSFGLGLSVPRGQTAGAPGSATGQTLLPGAQMNNLSLGYRNNDKEQITRATLGQGEVNIRDQQGGKGSLNGLNRDIANAQEITDRDEENYNFYISDASLRNTGILDNNKKKGDGSQLVALENTLDFQDAVDDMGDSMKEGIMELDDSLMAGFTLGAQKESQALDRALNNNPLGGLVPSDTKNGGLLGQADVLLGNEDKLHQERVFVKEGRDLLENNQDRFTRIEDIEAYENFSQEKKEELEGFYVSKRDVQFSENEYTKFNFTNGMNNSLYDAAMLAKKQTESGAFTVNYNPTYGGVSDFLESAQDMVFGAWLGNAPVVGQMSASLMTSGISEQTANFIQSRVSADNDKDYALANHSQGNILLAAGLNSGIKLELGERRDASVTSYGSPVNLETMKLITTKSRFNMEGMKSNEGDFIAETIGRNFGQYNKRKNRMPKDVTIWKWAQSIGGSTVVLSSIWNSGDEDNGDAHGDYECIASCGDLE